MKNTTRQHQVLLQRYARLAGIDAHPETAVNLSKSDAKALKFASLVRKYAGAIENEVTLSREKATRIVLDIMNGCPLGGKPWAKASHAMTLLKRIGVVRYEYLDGEHRYVVIPKRSAQ